MQTVNIEVTNRRASVIGAPVLVCNNTGDTVKFTFDDEWAGAEQKTARFVYMREGKAIFQEVDFTGDTVEIPPLSHVREVKIGVYAGALTTTTAARVACEPSILCECSEETANAYELGRQAEYDLFWDSLQAGGKRTEYRYAFADWAQECFYPKYDITPKIAEGLFRGFMYTREREARVDLAARLEACGVRLDLSKATNATYAFYTTSIDRLPIIDLSSVAQVYACFGYFLGTTIDKIILSAEGTQTFTSPFGGARFLQHLDVGGVIGRSIDFSPSPLTPQSMKNVITHLKNYAGTDKAFAYTISFNADCWAALEAEGSTSPNGNSWADYVTDLGWNK